MDNQILKRLQTEQKELSDIVQSLEDKKKEVNEDCSKKKSKLDQVKKRIRELTSLENGVIVSEHAMLRYLERVRGVNLKELHDAILTHEIEEKIKTLGNGVYPVGGTHQVKVRDGTVVTIMTKKDLDQ